MAPSGIRPEVRGCLNSTIKIEPMFTSLRFGKVTTRRNILTNTQALRQVDNKKLIKKTSNPQ